MTKVQNFCHSLIHMVLKNCEGRLKMIDFKYNYIFDFVPKKLESDNFYVSTDEIYYNKIMFITTPSDIVYNWLKSGDKFHFMSELYYYMTNRGSVAHSVNTIKVNRIIFCMEAIDIKIFIQSLKTGKKLDYRKGHYYNF